MCSSDLTNILNDATQYKALIFSGLVMFGHFLIIPFINPYMELNVGFPRTITPLIYLVGGITSFFSANILGKLSDTYGKLLIFNICVFTALPFVFVITNLPPTQLYIPVLVVFGLWFMASTGRGVTASAMVSNVVKAEHRGSFQSFNSSLQQLGKGLATLLSGFVVSKEAISGKLLHYDIVGYISILVLLICVFLAKNIFKK